MTRKLSNTFREIYIFHAFLGFSSFVKESICYSSSSVDFCKRMDLQAFEELNTAIEKLSSPKEEQVQDAETLIMLAAIIYTITSL